MEEQHAGIDLSWFWTTLASLGTGFGTWFFARRKSKAEAQSNEIDNVDKAVAIWRKLAEDMEERVSKLLAHQAAIETELHKLRADNEQLREENAELREANEALRVEVETLKTRMKP